uniref:Uncharacterized protein n=1 Tax=Rhizophora mucronata TaxID=61149 RepID=A0A2P2JPV7_RHIMU
MTAPTPNCFRRGTSLRNGTAPSKRCWSTWSHHRNSGSTLFLITLYKRVG